MVCFGRPAARRSATILFLPEDAPGARTIDRQLLERVFRQAGAARWGLSPEEFAAALTAGAERAFQGSEPGSREMERFFSGLHLADLALACACGLGREQAWDHFVVTHRPVLYRAADSLDPAGGARELADALYGELYGVADSPGGRRSLFRYFHGRSSLATWLRAVLSQRHVDAIRARRRTDPLPDDESALPAAPLAADDPDRPLLVAAIELALRTAIGDLAPRDRLRLRSYYASGLTLAEIGRITGEHEATVSRHLARTRRGLREVITAHLKTSAGLNEDQVTRALELAVEDPGAMDLQQMFDMSGGKESAPDRSR
jgi:RNA polymerase sigma-70 factor (ECF subfamily)